MPNLTQKKLLEALLNPNKEVCDVNIIKNELSLFS